MGLTIHSEKLTPESAEALRKLCPFGALEYMNGRLSVNAGCKGCRLCVKNSGGAVTWEEEEKCAVRKDDWQGIAVFGEMRGEHVHPVTKELCGKARELADVIGHKVTVVLIGSGTEGAAEDLRHYGADRVAVYDDPAFAEKTVLPFTAAVTDYIRAFRPCAMLFGATTFGRSLAPRVAARCHAGLTADCTMLEMKETTDLVQIRPAFGGNIMARIVSPDARPQFCTVRYKTFSAPERTAEPTGEVIVRPVTDEMRRSGTEVLSVAPKAAQTDISEAEVLVACGRGVRRQEDLAMIKELCDLLGGQMAFSRPLVEAGWGDARQQIGLSGRTVKPRFILTLGISGSVQFAAGMKASDFIVSVNTDPDAPIFHVAHVGVVGDLYEIVPEMIRNLREGKRNV